MRILSTCERPAGRFVLAPIRRIVWTSDQTEFVVVYFPCVVSVHAQFMMCAETTEPYIQESSGENGSLNSHDLEYDDYTIGRALSSPLFIQE